MILIYSNTTSYRLQYICQFIFKEQLGTPYGITLDPEGFKEYNGPRINYSLANFEDPHIFNIRNHPLLFERDIRQQEITCFESGPYQAFFETSDSAFPFDIFAASFYLLSRYEEYLPHTKDMYGRYAHENSIAFKGGFLHQPLVNIWLKDFSDTLKALFPALHYKLPAFNYRPTYDIDIAWSYRSKGFIRNAGGFLMSPSLERIKVLLGLKNDPFDAYVFLDTLHKKYHLHPAYFFLVAAGKSKYDKNIARDSKPMVQLIQRHVQQYTVGLHPSWKSHNDPAALKEEKHYLEAVSGTSIDSSRQHYIKFSLPETFRQLINAGITNDYSMGYGSINGFRASIASPFYWYDLQTDKQTALRLHPFCYMDANSLFEQKSTAAQAYDELRHYYTACQAVNGTFITIFHNNFLGDGELKAWREMYERFMAGV
jgi:hypothetical protein